MIFSALKNAVWAMLWNSVKITLIMKIIVLKVIFYRLLLAYLRTVN